MPGPLPEGSPLSVRWSFGASRGCLVGSREQLIDSADQLPPARAGDVAGTRVTEFTRAGAAWVFTRRD